MQCFLVFDHLNDVVYVKRDAAFDAFIRRKWKDDGFAFNNTAESENGRTTSAGSSCHVGASMDYCNALVQFFSPLVTSQRIMTNQFSSPYSALQCEDGVVLVLAEYLGYVALLIGRDEGLTEALLRRKLGVFLRLFTFVCGPTLDVLKTSTTEGNSRRKLLDELIDTWTFLYGRELSFLLEAEEQLITNSDLCATWVKLLQNVLEKLRTGWPSDKCTACHAFVLVNAKILALYSRNACVLSEADTLLLTVLATARQTDLVQPRSRTRDRHPTTTSNASKVAPRKQESTQSSDSEQFYSPCGSPFRPAAGGQAASSEEEVCTAISKINIEKGVAQEDEAGAEPQQLEVETELTEGFVDIAAELSCDLVFLQSSVSSLAPHLAHTAHIAPGIALVVVSMVNRHALSGCLMRAIDTLHEIQRTPIATSAKTTVDALDSMVRSIIESLKKQKALATDVDINLKRLQASWNLVKRSGLLIFLKLRDLKCLSPRLERELSKLSSLLKQFFQKYCVHWFRRDFYMTLTSGALIDVQALVRFTLADYVDYLRVKANQNISMAPYYSEFPGLVHFMYVDRVTNQITTPSVDAGLFLPDQSDDGDKHPPGIVVGDFVWLKLCAMVSKAWEHLRLGHTSVVWRDNCFHYSYFIWFEDAVGNPFKPEVQNISMDGFPLPGIISKNFYRQFIRASFPSSQDFMRCYELFCVHLSTVPSSMVSAHARQLAAKMWEISGAAQSPIDLL